MNKKKLVALIILIIGIILIVLAFIVKPIKKNVDNQKQLDGLEFSNLKITSENSLTLDVYNSKNQKIENKMVNLYLLNDKKEVIIIGPFSIEELNSKTKKTIEFSQESPFAETPVDFYVKPYVEGEDNEVKESIADDVILGRKLRDLAEEVVQNNFQEETELNINLTAKEMEDKYNMDLGNLKDEKYKCDLEQTYVEITLQDNNYEYVTNLYCDAFLEE